MSSLVVFGFKNEASADNFASTVDKMQDEGLVEIDDHVKVTVDPDGKVNVHKSGSLVSGGAVVGGYVGAIVGLLFLAPFAGAAIGAAGGAGIGALSGHYGIDDDFIKQTSALLKPGAAALFYMFDKAMPEQIEAEIRGADTVVINTTLSDEAKAQLESALAGGSAAS